MDTKRGYEFLVKLLVIGDSAVGKTCVLLRFCEDSFHMNPPPSVGVDIFRKNITVLGKRVKVDIWDSAGNERFRTITTTYMRGAMGMVLVYDITDESSFDDIQTTWIPEVERHATGGIPMILIGNKFDLEENRVVSTKRGQQLADKLGIPFFEVSALVNLNLVKAFDQVVGEIIENIIHTAEIDQTSVGPADSHIKKEDFKAGVIDEAEIGQPISENVGKWNLLSSIADNLQPETLNSMAYKPPDRPNRSILADSKDLTNNTGSDNSIHYKENKSSDEPYSSLGTNASNIVAEHIDNVITEESKLQGLVEQRMVKKLDDRPAMFDRSSGSWPSIAHDRRCALCRNIHVGHEFDFMHYNERTLKASASRGCPLCAFFYDVLVLQCKGTPQRQTPHSQIRVTYRDEKLEVFDFLSKVTTFEFYRLRGLVGSDSVGTSLREVYPHPNSSACFQMASDWIMACVKSHDACDQKLRYSTPPTRLIDVSKQRPILVTNTQSVDARYIALSYCWGAGNVTTTTIATLQSRCRGISMDSLPKTLQHAVSITRRHKIKYLWIDSLCILQDSLEDWQQEARKMGDYYHNAFLTLSALDSSDANSGMLRPRDYIPSVQLEENLYMRPASRSWQEVFRDAPLSRRAWALQERMVSTRILHYGIDALFWECLTTSKRESSTVEHTINYQSTDGLGWDFKRSLYASIDHPISCEDALRNWYRIILRYSELTLTRKEDRLPALSGIASKMQDITSYSYLAGLWKEDLHNGLLWFREGPAEAPQTYRAPSWSWACCDSSIDLMFSEMSERTHSEFDAEIVDSWATCISKDRFGMIHEAGIIISVLMKDIFYKGSRGIPPYDDDELDVLIDIFDENGLRIGTGYLDHLDHPAPISTVNSSNAPNVNTQGKECAKAIWICERREKNSNDNRVVIYFLLVIPEPSPIVGHRERFIRIGVGHTQDLLSKEILGDGSFYDCESYVIDLV